jgi:hypothetical protein
VSGSRKWSPSEDLVKAWRVSFYPRSPLRETPAGNRHRILREHERRCEDKSTPCGEIIHSTSYGRVYDCEMILDDPMGTEKTTLCEAQS